MLKLELTKNHEDLIFLWVSRVPVTEIAGLEDKNEQKDRKVNSDWHVQVTICKQMGIRAVSNRKKQTQNDSKKPSSCCLRFQKTEKEKELVLLQT